VVTTKIGQSQAASFAVNSYMREPVASVYRQIAQQEWNPQRVGGHAR
jgi:hypothetical protein